MKISKTALLPGEQAGEGPRSSAADGLPLSKVVRAHAADGAADQLAELIHSGQLAVGDRLPSEIKLAEMLGVSRPVVREALRSLRSLGMVESKPGSGSFVAEPRTLGLPLLLGRYRATDLHEVRTLIEVPAAGFAAARASEEQRAALAELIERMAKTSDHAAYAELDARFHITLAECTANPIHVRLVSDLHELIVENSDMALSADQTRQEQATAEHRKLVQAVARADVRAAEAAMREHLGVVSELLHAHFDEQAKETRRPDGH